VETLSEAVPVPARVPPEAVYDFDLRHDPALLAEPHERLRELLRDDPREFAKPENFDLNSLPIRWD
jgi:hypothetical protein